MTAAGVLYATTSWGLLVDQADLAGLDVAVFSRDRRYRYALTRVWDTDPGVRMAVWLLLNPSRADALRGDPTLARCISFARREGCGGLLLLNLFAVRSPQPTVMMAHPHPVGEHNDRVLDLVAGRLPGALWITGWGAHGTHQGRADTVRAALAGRARLHHLGPLTKSGQPGHPLYLPATAPLHQLAPAAPTAPGRNR
jgi:hypothetical protein